MDRQIEIMISATLLIFTAFSFLVFAETSGNISLNSSDSSVVTGLWGMTVTTTAPTTTTINTTTTTVVIQTGSSQTDTATTTTVATTTTLATTTTSTISIVAQSQNLTQTDIQQILLSKPGMKSAIEEYFGSFEGAIDMAASEAVSHNVSIIKDFSVSGNSSKIEIKILYNGTEPIDNMVFFHTIPKSFASSSDNIRVITFMEYVVVEKDPVYMLTAKNMNHSSIAIVDYIVDSVLNSTVLEGTEIVVLVGRPTPEGMPLWMYMLGFMILVWIAVAVIFKDEIIARVGGKKEKKYCYQKKEGVADKIKEILSKIRQKLTGKKDDVKFVYRYQGSK